METNPKKRLSSLMVYLELKENTNYQTYLDTRTISKNLEEKFGAKNRPSHNTVAAILKDMKECGDLIGVDVKRGNSRQGYCLAEREFTNWEINLFIEAITNNKTLTLFEKKDLIDKCIKHLGFVSDEDYDKIIDPLYENSNNKNIKNIDIDDTLHKLNKAISEKKKVYIQKYMPTMNNRKTIKHKFYTRLIHPYRIIEINKALYLIYGFNPNETVIYNKQKKNTAHSNKLSLIIQEINNIDVLKTLKDNVADIKTIEGFENGLDEKKLRNDPIGYIRNNHKTIQAELLKKGRNGIKARGELKRIFGDDALIYNNSKKEYVYIDADYEKCLKFFLYHPSEFKVIKPVDLVLTIRELTNNLFITYGKNLKPKKYKSTQTDSYSFNIKINY